MEKAKVFNVFLNIVIVVVIIISVCYSNSALKKLEEHSQEIERLNGENLNQQKMIYSNQHANEANEIDIVDLWFATLEEGVPDKIKAWESSHEEAVTCEKNYANTIMSREYFDNKPEFARVIVYAFEKGDMVYERDGTIHCSLYPILKVNPPSVDCKSLCLDYNETEE